ncbi:hypothetical protein J4N45_14260 [Vibrio sp. SCSIO 43140]|uniref:hypothetical protein n=1 Tax=Vibrio sp. SCSIO 43140 TaxID=2819100 RepID=UPI002075093D|nr:hypothetical protein [Vibrio sp. SCSIO 43140]USD59668.1 hypothetical protein J4N45_14260 [Vibrio sp. SCSIO 43140]
MKLISIQKTKLLCSALAVALLAGCSSSGGSSSPTEPLPEFDGDLGFENVDPGYGNSAPEGSEPTEPDFGFDLGYVYIPDLGLDVPVHLPEYESPVNPNAKISTVKERDLDGEILYSITYNGKRVGEILIKDDVITISSLHSEHTITGSKNGNGTWTVRDSDGNIRGDVKRIDDGKWIVREEISRASYIVVYHEGEWKAVPVADIKPKLKEQVNKERIDRVKQRVKMSRPS